VKSLILGSIILICKVVADLRPMYCILVCLVVTLSYQHVVAALVPNTVVMPAMDQQTYISTPKSVANYMNA